MLQETFNPSANKIINLTYQSNNIGGLINISILSYKFYVQDNLKIFKGHGKVKLEINADYLKTKHNFHCVLQLYGLGRNDEKKFDNLLFKCDVNMFFTNRPTREEFILERDNIQDIIMDHFKIDFSSH